MSTAADREHECSPTCSGCTRVPTHRASPTRQPKAISTPTTTSRKGPPRGSPPGERSGNSSARCTVGAPQKTRFQIRHGNAGTLWLSDIRPASCDPPAEGRWASGIYLDRVQVWDHPYLFFRWRVCLDHGPAWWCCFPALNDVYWEVTGCRGHTYAFDLWTSVGYNSLTILVRG